MNRGNTLYLVLPCYNEEEIIEKTIETVRDKMSRMIQEDKISTASKMVFVNDGSKDNTAKILANAALSDESIAIINFSKNFGHQNAILAGMMLGKEHADMVVTIDADLQQDIEALDQFIECYQNGADIVYGVRNNRDTDGWLKKMTASMYYKLLNAMGCNILSNHADYRLMSAKALNVLAEYKEVNLFMRGLVSTLGFQSDVVYFDVKKREAGKSKYTLSKMCNLALDGITSMSIKPLHVIALLGMGCCLFGVVLAILCMYDWLMGNNIPGYTTTIMIMLIMNGITLLSLGIIGEYIGKIYMETKERPRYIIESMIWKE